MKRFIDIHIPINHCNLNCHYCYVTQCNMRDVEAHPYQYSAEYVGKALTQERLGGICHFNICGLGETLIHDETVKIIYQLLKNGHYVMVVTNGLIRRNIEKCDSFPVEYRKRLGFKFSFHFLQLKERALIDTFFDNVDHVRSNQMSISIEVTPCDELEAYIDEVKSICMRRVGAYPHLTIPRRMNAEIGLLSEHSFIEFCEIWKGFESDLFEFKKMFWGEKRKEFCYAGEWSGLLDVGNGELRQCYGSSITQNIFKDIDQPINWTPIGHHCTMPHCFNSHALLAVGVIPEIECNYASLRDRVDSRDGSHWLTDEMLEFLGHSLKESNEIYDKKRQRFKDATWIKRKILQKMRKYRVIR